MDDDVCTQVLTMNDFDLKCPITMLYFREPVSASDGHVYEKDAINSWINSNRKEVSPLTREPLVHQFNPCHIIKKIVDSLEEMSSDPFFYMSRYQYNLRHWIQCYVKKFKIDLTEQQHDIIDDIPDEIVISANNTNIHSLCKSNICTIYSGSDCSYDGIFHCLKLDEHWDKININVCRYPQRRKLYECINKYNHVHMIEKIIKSTSPCDEGLKYFLKINNENNKIFHLLTPELHFKLFSNTVLSEYIGSFDSHNQFLNFLDNGVKYVDESLHIHILGSFVCNPDLFLDCNDVINQINDLFEKYVDSMDLCNYFKENIITNLCQTDYIFSTQYSVHGIEIVHKIIHRLIELNIFGFSNIYDVLTLINQLMNFQTNHEMNFDQAIKDFEVTLNLMIETLNFMSIGGIDNISDFFEWLGTDYSFVNINIFQKWFNDDTNILVIAQSAYFNTMTLEKLCPRIIQNLNYLINLSMSVPVEQYDLGNNLNIDSETYADLVTMIPENIDFIKLTYSFLKRQKIDDDVFKCAIIGNVNLELIDDIYQDIINTTDNIQLVHKIGNKEYSIASSLLENKKSRGFLSLEKVIGLIVKKCSNGLEFELAKKILSSNLITIDILLHVLPCIKVNNDILKSASMNPQITLDMLKHLICRMR